MQGGYQIGVGIWDSGIPARDQSWKQNTGAISMWLAFKSVGLDENTLEGINGETVLR